MRNSTASIRRREFFIGNFGPLGGGWGAKRNEDGVSGTVAINDGDTHNSPNEQVESKFPIVVERYALVPGSGGPGRHRGGLGVERVVRARSHITVNTRSIAPIAGPGGSTAAATARATPSRCGSAAAWKADFPNAKVLVAQVKAGDAFRLRSGGGGGYGSPLSRPVEDVRNDVRQGYVSAEDAADHYGVVVDAETFEVDERRRIRLRADLSATSS